jgi:hypothetical protein
MLQNSFEGRHFSLEEEHNMRHVHPCCSSNKNAQHWNMLKRENKIFVHKQWGCKVVKVAAG